MSKQVYVVIEWSIGRLNECGTSVYTELDSAIEYASASENSVEIRQTFLDVDCAYAVIPFTKND